MLRTGCTLTAFLLLIATNARSSSAFPVTYSWSGQIYPIASAPDNPWQIGSQGGNFSVQVTVEHNADDVLNADVLTSGFNVSQAKLSIEGSVFEYTGMGTLEFDDSIGNVADIILFAGDFTKFGHTLEIEINAALPLDSFHFTSFVEPPPIFETTSTLYRSSCCGGTYSAAVGSGQRLVSKSLSP
jgi:hypothetical protein